MEANTVKAVSDTLAQANNKSDSGWILHHILDSKYIDFEPFGRIYLPEIHLFGIDISITKHVVFMWLSLLILVLVFYFVSKSYKKSRVPKGFANVAELLVVFVRDDIARPTIGKGFEKFLPYLLTVFFFILTANFLGLFPYSATVTSNISVTATLAAISFLVTQAGGIRKNGLFGYFKGLIPHGVPVFLLPVMLVVEILGLFTRPFALAIRLFANMTAGHIVILALLGLIFILKTIFVAPVSVAFALFIYLLEILVALIQAYIFTMLSSLFIGMAVHQEH
ncbi:MAG: F0F1 ATP synthase subunit A [Ignavibacteria bacterium]|jgi:F-type H+-transporting ATPase subunit a|nr:F0F1 ATP synthase subunit A [Ignavibacteria bacterium]HEX2962159.1 F0F1 ATP synthase subunit A [Ignavibacteriales bacterium]MCU7499567.1 F0F1 ATP synthase subunit A [Ignavibacteria bacterium]MCU7513046.1 F0F1 ATP synthase subunit A [Ignavibacteria bacterium]MCU7519268.1 F0F1 ATP synthase subunit A [Ignavibacteria bacterium]